SYLYQEVLQSFTTRRSSDLINKKSEQKKKEISNVIIKLIYRDGLDTVSFRKISNESGWSLGSIQNFFGNQQSLLIFIFKIISEKDRKSTRLNSSHVSISYAV